MSGSTLQYTRRMHCLAAVKRDGTSCYRVFDAAVMSQGSAEQKLCATNRLMLSRPAVKS